MTLKEIDKALSTWQADLSRMITNQSELEELDVYQVARSRPLEGQTGKRVLSALDAASRSWEDYSLLEDLLKRARVARANLPGFGQGKALAQIEELLKGRSIALPPIPIPVEERTLTSESSITPMTSADELKAKAIAAFDAMKTTLLLLKESWSCLSQLAKTLASEVELVVAQARDSGHETQTEFTALATKLKSFQDRRVLDPFLITLDPKTGKVKDRPALQAAVTWFMTPELDRARARLGDLGHERQRLADQIPAAREQLKKLTQRREKALELYQECLTELKSDAGLAKPGSTKRVVDLFGQLETASKKGDWKSVRQLIDEWSRALPALQAACEAAVEANRAPIARLKELRRRWAAAKLETEKYRKKGLVVDKALSNFAAKAEELTTVKVDLDQAEQMIYSYETRLGELITRLAR